MVNHWITFSAIFQTWNPRWKAKRFRVLSLKRKIKTIVSGNFKNLLSGSCGFFPQIIMHYRFDERFGLGTVIYNLILLLWFLGPITLLPVFLVCNLTYESGKSFPLFLCCLHYTRASQIFYLMCTPPWNQINWV